MRKEKNRIKHLILDLQLFAEDEKKDPEDPGENPPEDSKEEYIKAITELKKTSVPKDKYDALLKENKNLLSALVDGAELPPDVKGKIAASETEPAKRIEELRGELFGPDRKDMTNLETVQKTLEMRKLIIELTGVDPAVSAMKNPKEEDYEMAEKAAELLESCVEQADGNPEVFTAVLQSKLVDDRSILAKRPAKR